jgi:pimeloyl-ACP methyl ester carboxylesterase
MDQSSVPSGDQWPVILPFDGEMARAPERRFQETIVFVHHFGGDRRTTLRHRKFVNKLGFDAVSFTLNFNHFNPAKGLPISGDLAFGARHLWTEQIEAILNALPGRKMIYSFSMPSNSAFEAIARRHAEDVTAVVCDGGPFLQLLKCTWNLYQHEFAVRSRVLRAVFTGLGLLMVGPGTEFELGEELSSLPAGLPVLSIRGTEDPLVPIEAIEEFLAYAPQVSLKTLTLDGGHHLDGLKKFPEIYTSVVEDFLVRHALRAET